MLICRRRLGLALAAVIMVLDVAVNSYVAYGLLIGEVRWFVPLQLQTLFCGLVLCSVGFVWRASSRPAGEVASASHV
jgi:hypothetical protein